MTLKKQREYFIHKQLMPGGIHSPYLLDAFLTIGRDSFLEEKDHPVLYTEKILIESGRPLLPPLALGRLLQALVADEPRSVLYIAPGSGYGLSLLTFKIPVLYAFEPDVAFRTIAQSKLQQLDITGPHFIENIAAETYEAIFIEGAIQHIPDSLWKQLAPNGHIVSLLYKSPHISQARKWTSQESIHLFDMTFPLFKGF